MNPHKQLTDEIDRLKREKPEGWKKECRSLLRVIQKREEKFSEHEYHGNEFDGRKALPMRSPPI